MSSLYLSEVHSINLVKWIQRAKILQTDARLRTQDQMASQIGGENTVRSLEMRERRREKRCVREEFYCREKGGRARKKEYRIVRETYLKDCHVRGRERETGRGSSQWQWQDVGPAVTFPQILSRSAFLYNLLSLPAGKNSVHNWIMDEGKPGIKTTAATQACEKTRYSQRRLLTRPHLLIYMRTSWWNGFSLVFSTVLRSSFKQIQNLCDKMSSRLRYQC